MVRVVVSGHVNWDVTLRVDRLPVADGEALVRDQRRGGGGSAANVAAALVDLGIPAGVIGAVGRDDPGDHVRDELASAGVNVDGLRRVDGETTSKYLLVDPDGEVAVVGNEGVNEALSPSDIDPSLLSRGEHLHLTNQRPETAAALARAADERELTISVDPGRRAADRDFSAAVDRADVVFATEHEVSGLSETPSELASGGRLVAVKRGGRGAVLHSPDGTDEVSGLSVDAIDTSGAGDAFAAGFLSAWLDDADRERALALANACGAAASRERGARADLDWTSVEALATDQASVE